MNITDINQLVSHTDDIEWDYLDGQSGEDALRWKTLTGRRDGNTTGVSFGICEVPPGVGLGLHRHAEQEVYYVYQGDGEITMEDEKVSVRSGSVLFVPGDMAHGVKNTGSETLGLLWVFPVDKWADVEYELLASSY